MSLRDCREVALELTSKEELFRQTRGEEVQAEA